jgi:AcrR family transcriptional regulator
MLIEPEVSQPGSKRLNARREAFLAAGRAVFQEKGFAAATLDDIIARSGGSRQTLYSLFGGKQGLFEAIITDICDTIFHGLTPDEMAPRVPEEALEELGVRYLSIVTSEECINLHRLVIAEADRLPEMGQRFWKSGPGQSRAFLTQYFDGQVARGLLAIPDTAAAADHFLGMLSGTIRMLCLIGLRAPPDEPEIRRFTKLAVRQFLSGCEIKAPVV